LNICLWGTVPALHSVAQNFATLVALRTLLGIFEAVSQPSFLIMSSMWYKREEQAATVTGRHCRSLDVTRAMIQADEWLPW
jgi:MFS family permease